MTLMVEIGIISSCEIMYTQQSNANNNVTSHGNYYSDGGQYQANQA